MIGHVPEHELVAAADEKGPAHGFKLLRACLVGCLINEATPGIHAVLQVAGVLPATFSESYLGAIQGSVI